MTTYIFLSQMISITKFKLIILLLFLSINKIAFPQQERLEAFPTAEGFGKYASGGRGGSVIKVTNLNDSGPGSLRQALQYSSGSRTVIFEVGGTITLKSMLPITNGNITIAGQTAPGDGILITGSHILVESSNVIIRYIRFRPDKTDRTWADALRIVAWRNDIVENIIVDHCSLSWAEDENLDIGAATSGTVRNITIQNSIIAESGYGVLSSAGSYNLTFYKNLFAHNRERNIHSNLPSGGTFNFEMINNIIYGFRWATGVAIGTRFTVINNLYKMTDEWGIGGSAVDGTTIGAGIISDTDGYIIGNIAPIGMSAYNSILRPYVKSSPFSGTGIIALSANQLENEILSHVGASLPTRDAVDIRLIDQYENGHGTFKSSGTFPIIQNGIAPVDTDNDGMPDEWEIANGLDPNNPDDRNFFQPDGYTNLEYFLNGMILQTAVLKANAGDDVSICQGASTILTATGGSTYLWSTGETTASITVSPHETTTYTVTAFDSTGENSDSDEVVVTVNPLPKVNAGSDVTINSGETVTLTASGAESYRWNTGATTQSIKVSPTSTTTYTVVGTTNGCEASDDVTVFSVEASVKANAGEDTEICSGSSATLTASGGSTYLWSTGATSASITVSPNETTTYSVTVYGKTITNFDTDEVVVTVKPLPIVDAGSDITIEQGESAILTATGATSYKWNTGADGASITVSPSSTRTYTVTGTSNGCQATDRVRVVVLGTVEVIADAGKDQQICIGSSATLTATGGATYLWSTGETTASITVNPNSTTTYSVTAYDATGNFSDTDDVIVTVNPLPVVSAGKNVTIYSGESTVLSATGANSYKWSTGDTGASVTVSPTTTQTYTVTGRSNGCEDTSTVSVVVLPAVEVIADAGKNQQICKGSSATLTATGGATYLWSTGETTASISVSPNSTTKYTVTVYDDTGKFSDTDDVMVTVNPLPVINAGKNVTINSGESTILTATGATSYKWNTGAVGNKITVRPTVTTTYTVTGVSNGCEAVSTVTVTVKTPQKVVASAGKDQDICEGGSVKLTATGGETYLWSTGAKTPSITVSPKSTAKYSVTAYVGDVSAKAEVVVNVTANPKVKIANGSETSLLKGERVTLSASGAKTYKWNNGAVQPNITVIPNSTQTYKVTGFNDKCAAERSVKVNVLEKVVASAGKDVTIYRNEKTVLTATGPKGSEYLWSTGETTKSITVSPEESTVYSVMVYHALDSDTANVTVNVIDLVDEDILDDSTNLKFLIHPNPTNGELHVKVSGLTYLSSIHLYDLSGKSLYSEIINESDHHTYVKTLDLSNYATGIYLLQLVNNNSVITKKVVLR